MSEAVRVSSVRASMSTASAYPESCARAFEVASRLGRRLVHVHLTDGRGSNKDEHLVPGRGTQPCAELLERLADSDWGGEVIVEISTRRAASTAEREDDLAQSLAFARLNLVAPSGRSGGPEASVAGQGE
jgi:hypothetical protein